MDKQSVKQINNSKETIKKLIKYLAPYKVSFGFALFFAIISTIFAVVGPRLMGNMTTALVDGVMANHFGLGLLTNFSYMAGIALTLVGLYIISFLSHYAQQRILAKLTVKITFKLRTEISEKMHRLPINYYDTHTKGDILSRITNDISTMTQSLNQGITQLLSASTTIIGTIVMMLSISPLMTVGALIIVPISLKIISLVMNNSHKFFSQQQQALGEVSSIAEEVYASHSIVRTFSREEDTVKKFDTASHKLQKATFKANFITSVVEPIFSFIGNLGYVMVAVLGGYLAVNGSITIGDVQAFIQYMQNLTQPLSEVGTSSNVLQSTIAASERVIEFLEEEEEIADISKSNISEVKEEGIAFKNVYFGYNPNKIIINNFSAHIEKGQTIAIVGPTGAGKTTIVKLLTRFYELNGGSINIDGTPLTNFTRKDLRDKFGMVLQDTWLYNASIMDNIRYGSPNATKEDVIAAAKAAHCHDFILQLPGGYDLLLNEEASNISQGQKQLFTIARVILKNPDILILDEATSSIDTRTEVLVQQAMKNIMKNRTSFVIAHRLSTIKDADIIFVMKDGEIIEQGNHNHLLEVGGFYADLYNSQYANGGSIGEE